MTASEFILDDTEYLAHSRLTRPDFLLALRKAKKAWHDEASN